MTHNEFYELKTYFRHWRVFSAYKYDPKTNKRIIPKVYDEKIQHFKLFFTRKGASKYAYKYAIDNNCCMGMQKDGFPFWLLNHTEDGVKYMIKTMWDQY